MNGDELEAVREEVIESMERSAEMYGLSRSAGRVYGTLYFAADPLSIPGLVDETGYAKSTISNVTRKLTRIGLVRRRSSGGGGRRVRFEARSDLWYVIQDVIRQHVQREIGTTQMTLDRALERLQDLDDREVEADRDRLRELQSTYAELDALLQLALDHSIADLKDAIEDDG